MHYPAGRRAATRHPGSLTRSTPECAKGALAIERAECFPAKKSNLANRATMKTDQMEILLWIGTFFDRYVYPLSQR